MEKKSLVKKIIIIKNSSWAVYNFRFNLASYLKKMGYRIIIIAPEDNNYSELLKKDFEFIDIKLNSESTNPFSDIKFFMSILLIYIKIKPDLVLNFTIKPNIYSAIAASFLKIPSINNLTGLGTSFIKKNYLFRVVKILYRISLHSASHVFFQNHDDFNLFLENKIVSGSKCSLVPGSGVDINKFKPTSMREHNKFRFLMVSRILKDKGVIEYIDAAKTLNDKNAEFWLLGESSSDNQSAISKKDISILCSNGVIKYFDRTDDVKSFLDVVDCVVLPSYREGSPRSIMEASASGLPVIVSDVPGCRNVVDNYKTGLYCKVKDSFDLALKMKKLLNMSDSERKKMGEMGRLKMINSFNESIVLNSYLKEVKHHLSET